MEIIAEHPQEAEGFLRGVIADPNENVAVKLVALDLLSLTKPAEVNSVVGVVEPTLARILEEVIVVSKGRKEDEIVNAAEKILRKIEVEKNPWPEPKINFNDGKISDVIKKLEAVMPKPKNNGRRTQGIIAIP